MIRYKVIHNGVTYDFTGESFTASANGLKIFRDGEIAAWFLVWDAIFEDESQEDGESINPHSVKPGDIICRKYENGEKGVPMTVYECEESPYGIGIMEDGEVSPIC